MLTTKPSALRLVWLCLILAQGWCVSPLSNGFASQQERGRIEPVLRLEKPRYVTGEASLLGRSKTSEFADNSARTQETMFAEHHETGRNTES